MRKTVKARSRERGPTEGALLAGSSATAADLLTWCREVVGQVGALEARMRALADDGLAATMTELRGRAASGQLLDDLLPETFALVREAAGRALAQRHYDVQIMGGAVLHRGAIAEMRTGEGKTLTATLPACLHALGGGTVHVMTASQYLAERDAAWMRPVYEMLGLRIGVLGDEANPPPARRRATCAADITYGVGEQFCFDYLRDHMALDPGTVVQRGLDFALVDEADLVLVDRPRRLLPRSGLASGSVAVDHQGGNGRVIAERCGHPGGPRAEEPVMEDTGCQQIGGDCDRPARAVGQFGDGFRDVWPARRCECRDHLGIKLGSEQRRLIRHLPGGCRLG